MHRFIATWCCRGTAFALAMTFWSPLVQAAEPAEDCDAYYCSVGRTVTAMEDMIWMRNFLASQPVAPVVSLELVADTGGTSPQLEP